MVNVHPQILHTYAAHTPGAVINALAIFIVTDWEGYFGVLIIRILPLRVLY